MWGPASSVDLRTSGIGVVLALLVVVSGCQGSGVGPMNDKEKEIKQKALDAMDGADTYRMEMSVQADSDGTQVSIDASADINRTARKLQMDMSMNMPNRNIELTQYFNGTTAYQQINGQWQKRDISDQNPWNQSRIETQRELLNDTAFELVENATIDGTDVYVVKMEVSDQEIKNILAQQQFGGLGNSMDVESMTYKLYISHESYRMRRANLDGTLTDGDRTTDVTVDMRLFDYGEPIHITIPEEARNASSQGSPYAAAS